MFLETEKRPAGEPSRENDLSPLDEASKLLLKAADLIEERGWCQNTYTSPKGRLCILGALKTAQGVEFVGESNPTVLQASKRFGAVVGGRTYQWNDVPGRTKEEVVAKLRAVALG